MELTPAKMQIPLFFESLNNLPSSNVVVAIVEWWSTFNLIHHQ